MYIDKKFIKIRDSESSILDLFAGNKEKPFQTNADFFCYCASLGKINNKIIPTKNRADEGEVKESVFSNRDLNGIVFAIALDETKDLEILKKPDKCFEIFEGFVNGGLSLIQEKAKNLDEEELIMSLLSELKEFSFNNIPDIDDEVVEGPLDIE